MKGIRTISVALIVLAVAALSAVCWHSVQEIHYLKSFFPSRFTVAEACAASIVELVKVAIIALPLLVVIAICLHLLKNPAPRG